MNSLEVVDLSAIAMAQDQSYANLILASVNDHVVRMSVMTEDYFWHLHPDSDETFIVLEGALFIDLEDRIVKLCTGQLFTIPKGVKHKTRPDGARSVNLTVEGRNITTVRV